MTPRDSNKLEWFLLIFLAVLVSLPTAISFYPPMSDLAFHEATVGLLQHLGDPQFAPKSLYSLNLGHPNQLFHVISYALAHFFGTRIAIKTIVAATQLSILIGTARISAWRGKSPLLGLLSVPMSLGWYFYWGLITNLVGLAVLLFAWPKLVSASRSPTTVQLLSVIAIFVLLFFAHETAFGIAVVLFTVLAAISARSVKALFRSLVPGIVVGIVSLIHLRYAEGLFAKSVKRPPADFPTLGHRAARFMDSLFGTHPVEVWIALAFLLTLIFSLIFYDRWSSAHLRTKIDISACVIMNIIVLSISYVTTRRSESEWSISIIRWLSILSVVLIFLATFYRIGAWKPVLSSCKNAPEREQLRCKLEQSPELIAGCLLFSLFWIIPFNWNGATLLYERFLPPALVFIGIGIASKGRSTFLLRLALAALPLAVVCLALPQFGEANRASKELQPLLGKIPVGSAIALVQFEPSAPKGRSFSVQTLASRAIAERGGRASSQFTDSPIAIVTMKPQFRWERASNRFWTGAADLRLPHDLEMFSYALIHVSDPIDKAILRIALRPFATFVDGYGEWLLFASRFKTPPIASTELPSGETPSKSLRTVCQDVVDSMSKKSESSNSPQ